MKGGAQSGWAAGVLLLCGLAHALMPPAHSDRMEQCVAPSANPSMTSTAVATYCSEAAPVSRNEAYEHRFRFAPYIWMHPMARYKLDAVEHWLASGFVFDTNNTFMGKATSENFLAWHRDGVDTVSWTITAVQYDYGGADIVEGQSTAPIYCNAFYNATRNSYVFNYWMWYSYNGCSNQQVHYEWDNPGATLDKDIVEMTMDYYACDVGVHEGDWELIAVEVCADLGSVIQIQYDYHSYSQVLNCTDGECYFYNGTTHPLVFSSLGSHASYPYQANNIYVQVSNDFTNFLNVNLMDRSLADPDTVFVPSDDNVIAVYNPDEYDGVSANDALFETVWVTFQGRFGVTPSNDTELFDIKCINDNQTATQRCPNYYIEATVNGALALLEDDFFLVATENTSKLGPPAISSRDEFYFFTGSDPGKTHAGNVQCPDPSRYIGQGPVSVYVADLIHTGINPAFVVAGILVILGFLISVVAWVVYMRYGDAAKRPASDLLSDFPFLQLLATSFAAVGLFLMSGPLHDTLEIMQALAFISLYDVFHAFEIVLSVTAVAYGVCMLILAIIGFLVLPPLVDIIEGRSVLLMQILSVLYILILFLAGGLALLLFTLAMMALAGKILLDTFRDNVLGSLEVVLQGICLDLTPFGLKSVLCGRDFLDFSYAVDEVNAAQFLVGAIMFAMGVYMFMVAAGVAWKTFSMRQETS
eukprot:CAMPEP_0119128050 /NCGR_PEP_ID=MMETSP1310-20130426/6360_1 /TAXON_ID=464262 /ORGANISM="Genus nov. species nov., Strain RCC2339" /LENGTH=698 /DNA_ID=CAMNT_0007118355 /DNA_START=1 /DNA_END=2097 /DNA_ORIENTATION=-